MARKSSKVQIVVGDWQELGAGLWRRLYQGQDSVAAEATLKGSRFSGGQKWHWSVRAIDSAGDEDHGTSSTLKDSRDAADEALGALLKA